jgi:hypothetical protein
MSVDWVTQSVRLSLFSNAPITATEKDWQKITGQEEAENRTAIAGGKMYSGKFEGGNLSFAHSGPRLDVVLSAEEKEAIDVPKIPSLGLWSDVFQTFEKTMVKWLEQTTIPTVRLAFGALLLHQVDNREKAYEELDRLLYSLVADPKMKELFYRCNWPAESKAVPGLMINRLTGWSALRVTTNLLQLAGESFNVSAGPELHTVRLEIDHNTDQGHMTPFEIAQVVPIFKELVGLARENAEKGELP